MFIAKFPLGIAFTESHKSWYVVFLFSFISKHFPVSPGISFSPFGSTRFFGFCFLFLLGFLNKFIYFIYLLFLAVLGLRCYVWAFSSCSEWGFSCCSEWGFSCCGAQALGHAGFSSCGERASVVVARRP